MNGPPNATTPANARAVSKTTWASSTRRNTSNAGCARWLNDYAERFWDEKDLLKQVRRLKAENAELRRILSGEQIP